MELTNGWYSFGMDWTNPNAGQYQYLYALWYAVMERAKITNQINTNIHLLPPSRAQIYNYQYIKSLADAITELISSNVWVNIDFQNYEYTKSFFESIRFYPKRIDSEQWREAEGYNLLPAPSATRIDYSTVFKQMKIALEKMRFSIMEDKRAIANVYIKNGMGNQLSVSDSMNEAFENALEYPEDKFYKPENLDELTGFEAGVSFASDKWMGFWIGKSVVALNSQVNYTSRYQNIKFKITSLYQDVIPDLLVVCYSSKASNKTASAVNIFGAVLTENTYWSGAFGFNEGMNYRRFNDFGNGQIVELGLDLDFPENPSAPPKPIKNDDGTYTLYGTFAGSFNKIAFVCDWHSTDGFKLK